MNDSQAHTAQVSVVVRTKDRPRLLRRALASIAAQSLREIEVILVNEGGQTVPVRELATHFVEQNPDISLHLLQHDEPHGRAQAINDALAVASAPLYVLHDDDDSWQPEFLHTTVSFMHQHPEMVGVATRTWVIFEAERDGEMTELSREVLADDARSINIIDTAQRNIAPPISLVIRRDASDHICGFDPSLPVLEDWDFLLRLLLVGSVGFVSGEPLANWHHRREAREALSNSVYAEADAHRTYRARVRDKLLRHPSQSLLGVAIAHADAQAELSMRFDQLGEAISIHRLERAKREQEIVDAMSRVNQLLTRNSSELFRLRETFERHTSEALDLRFDTLEQELRGLAANVHEAHKKLDRISMPILKRSLRKVASLFRTKPAVSPANPAPSLMKERSIIPPAPKLTDSRWLDDDDVEMKEN